MVDVVQVVGAIALGPLVVLALLTWAQHVRESRIVNSQDSDRWGAILWTAAGLAVAAVVLGGDFVAWQVTVAVVAAGAITGVVLARGALRTD